jgi:DedD protein
MLLEKEPAPLGDNVEVIIPPIAGTKLPDIAPPVEELIEPITPPPSVTTAEPPPSQVMMPAPQKPVVETIAQVALPRTVAFAKGTYSVQLAAFTDDKGANAMANRVKRAGYPAYTEPIDTTRGMAWRVRVGPYKTREDAAIVRDRLKKNGYDSMVVLAR